MKKYAVAYCSSNGRSFSNTEPYIEEASTTTKEVLKHLIKNGCCHLIPFEVKDKMESYTWEYVNKNKVIVE